MRSSGKGGDFALGILDGEKRMERYWVAKIEKRIRELEEEYKTTSPEKTMTGFMIEGQVIELRRLLAKKKKEGVRR